MDPRWMKEGNLFIDGLIFGLFWISFKENGVFKKIVLNIHYHLDLTIYRRIWSYMKVLQIEYGKLRRESVPCFR